MGNVIVRGFGAIEKVAVTSLIAVGSSGSVDRDSVARLPGAEAKNSLL